MRLTAVLPVLPGAQVVNDKQMIFAITDDDKDTGGSIRLPGFSSRPGWPWHGAAAGHITKLLTLPE